jgi:SAM-dependent methyltransferase
MTDEFSRYISGEVLYGDDFTVDEIKNWFADEAEGYADLGANDKENYHYGYHQLNKLHAFRFIKKHRFEKALGIGSAYGDEFKPIARNISNITILDPSDAFSHVKEILGIPCTYQKPNPSGDMEFESEHFDLITSLGVMHHIPNVSHVLDECNRCLNKKGIMLLREPITSMGDWRKPRNGLTKRERGIPLKVLDEIIKNAGFTVVCRSLCNFPLIPKVANKFGMAAYNSVTLTIADALLSKVFSSNIKYHRTRFVEKLAPASVYYILTK